MPSRHDKVSTLRAVTLLPTQPASQLKYLIIFILNKPILVKFFQFEKISLCFLFELSISIAYILTVKQLNDLIIFSYIDNTQWKIRAKMEVQYFCSASK